MNSKCRALMFCLAALAAASAPVHTSAGDGLDAFGTGEQLHRLTPGLSDPLMQMCEVPGRPLTLAMSVDLALCRNPTTRTAWAAAHQQAALLGEAKSAWLPDATATGTASRTIGQHLELTGEPSTSDQNTVDAAVNLSWTLYDFGARTGRISNARYLLDAAAATAGSSVQQTILSVVQSYYGLAAADASLAAAKTTESVTAHSLEMARTLRSAGPGTLADVLQAETAYDQAVLAREQADAAAQAARGTYAVTLGLIADYGVKIDAAPVPAEVPAQKARMADLMAEAMRQRPDLAAAQSQRSAAEANVQVARAAGLPVITINAGGDYITSTGIPNQHYGLIGINVSIPLFTGFSTAYGVRRAKAALEESEVALEQTRLAVSLGVWNAYYALELANEQLGTTAGLARTAEDNERVALSSYQAGAGRFIDVVTAQTAAATARQVRISAELNWRVSRAQLALALGRLSSVEPLQETRTIP
ncbi:MAG TPA: TolC family protein [Steroidobacteraceae bacterium]|jgi:outer membrane protein|nr:TolC family protein [Steroidobacteraceae bacterium]